MLRKASIVLGLAVLLALLFPVRALLLKGGVDPMVLRLQLLDLEAVCVLLALLPALALLRDGRVEQRLQRWNLWLGLLAFFSLVFLLLHVHASSGFVAASLRDAMAPGGSLALPVSHQSLLHGIELAARLGVLASLVGVLVNLGAEPEPDPNWPAPRRRRKKK